MGNRSNRLPAIFVASRQLWLALLVTLGIANGVIAIVGIWLFKIVYSNQFSSSEVFISLMLACLAFSFVLLQQNIAERLAQNYLADTREVLFSHILASQSSQMPQRLGTAMNRLINDTQSLKKWVGTGVASSISQGIALSIYLIAACYFWYDLAAILALCLLASAFICICLRSSIAQQTLEIRRQRGRLSGHVCERTYGYRNLLNNNQLNKETRKLRKNSTQLGYAMSRFTIVSTTLRFHGLILSQIALLLFMYRFLNTPDLEKQLLLPSLLLSGLFFSALSQLNTAFHDWLIFSVTRERLNYHLRQADTPKPEKENKLRLAQPIAIKIKNLSFLGVFQHLQYTANAGDRVLLSGLTGTGKSLLTALMIKQLNADTGRIVYNNRRLDWLNYHRLNRCVQLVNNESSLFKGTVLSNISYGNRKVNLDRVDNICRFIGLNKEVLQTSVNELGRHSPEGLKLKILIARALLKNPGLLLIDHPQIMAERELLNKLLIDKHQLTATVVVTSSNPQLFKADQYWQL